MSDNGIVYIAYQRDIAETKRHSGVYTDFDLCLEVLNHWKVKADKDTDRFNGTDGDYPYDTFSIAAYSLDCEDSGENMYRVQGDKVEVPVTS